MVPSFPYFTTLNNQLSRDLREDTAHKNIGQHTFGSVNEFVYLGSLITNNNNITAEIVKRILSANKCYFGLLKYFCSKILSRNIKILLYKTLLRPILIYGSETWVLSKKDENRLLVFERKILRRIFGAV